MMKKYLVAILLPLAALGVAGPVTESSLDCVAKGDIYAGDFNPFDPPKPVQTIFERVEVGDPSKYTDEAARNKLRKILSYVQEGYAVNEKGLLYAHPYPDRGSVQGKVQEIISPTEFMLEDCKLTVLKPRPKIAVGTTLQAICVRDKDSVGSKRAYVEVPNLEAPSQDQFVADLKKGQHLKFTAIEFRKGINSSKTLPTAVKYTVVW